MDVATIPESDMLHQIIDQIIYLGFQKLLRTHFNKNKGEKDWQHRGTRIDNNGVKAKSTQLEKTHFQLSLLKYANGHMQVFVLVFLANK